MKTSLLLSAAIAMAMSAPAAAQLLGGSGGLGGSLGGSLGGTVGSVTGRSVDSVRSATDAASTTTASTSGERSVDRRSGRVRANRSVSADNNSALSGVLGTPAGEASGNANSGTSANGNAGLDAQLIGTDDVRNLAAPVTSTARNAAAGTIERTRSAAASAPSALGNTGVSGIANAAGTVNSSLTTRPLAVAGSAAAAADGTFAVAPGMDVISTAGQRIGEVRQIIADGRGNVEAVLVRVGGNDLTLPAGSIGADGSALITSMTRAEARQAAQEQNAEPAPQPTETAAAQ